MDIEKAIGADSECVILDSDNYEGEINHIEILRERTNHRNESLMEEEEEQSAWRSELWKLMWVARIASPVAIYDDSAASRTFSGGGNGRIFGRIRRRHFRKWEKEDPPAKSNKGFGRIQGGFSEFYRGRKRTLTKGIFLK